MKGRPKSVRCSGEQSRRESNAAYSSNAGFSLLEVLFVFAIILLLATMYFGFASPNHQKRQHENCRINLQKIFVAMEIYANERGGKFPAVPGARTSPEVLNLLVPRYTADTSVFVCPGSKDSALTGATSLRNQKISYAYYMGRIKANAADALMSDKQVDTLPKTAGQAVFSADGKPPGNNHRQNGGNFLFCDGHTEHSPALLPFAAGLTSGVVLLNP